MTALEVLYEDNHCLAVNKPARMLTAADRTGDPSLLSLTAAYIKEKYHKPGNVFVGLVHRLDRPVSGVVLLARTSKAASRLSEQFRSGKVEKVYQAIVEGTIDPPEGTLVDWLVKDTARNVVARVAPGEAGARKSVLHYRALRQAGSLALLEVRPETGRSHQIRVQLAGSGTPIYGDTKYGSGHGWGHSIALHAQSLTFEHPVRREPITVRAPLPGAWQSLLERGGRTR